MDLAMYSGANWQTSHTQKNPQWASPINESYFSVNNKGLNIHESSLSSMFFFLFRFVDFHKNKRKTHLGSNQIFDQFLVLPKESPLTRAILFDLLLPIKRVNRPELFPDKMTRGQTKISEVEQSINEVGVERQCDVWVPTSRGLSPTDVKLKLVRVTVISVICKNNNNKKKKKKKKKKE